MISVVIPVYKTEKYLRNCIDSVISQTYTDIEIILVDDGSPDNCGKICDEYALKDARVKVFHTDNKGLSDARNLGIDMCSGDYVTFVDSDDRIDSDFIETLVELQKKHSADIVQCNTYFHNEHKGKELENEFIYSNIEAEYLLYSEYYIPTVTSTCKLINRKIFEKIRFESGKIHEDEFIIHKMLYYANKMIFINKKLYCVNRSDNSITRSKFSLKRLDYILALEDRLNFYSKHRLHKLYALTLYKYVISLKTNLIKVKKYFSHEDKLIKTLYQKSFKFFFIAIVNVNLPLRYKISLLIRFFKKEKIE